MKKLLLTACVAVGTLAALACDSFIASTPCNEIPDGGCPFQGGGECMDPTCAVIYSCNSADGGWSFMQQCPARDAGSLDGASEAAPMMDAGYDIDAPPGAFGGPGCEDLELPDCPLGEALICGSGCCGCEDLYICDDGGWNPWGECTDAGPVSSP